jgi:CubicO group peptidase (beta-lactamase class C family)
MASPTLAAFLAIAVQLGDPPATAPATLAPQQTTPVPTDAAKTRDPLVAEAADLAALLTPIADRHAIPAMSVAVITVDGPSRVIGLGVTGVRGVGAPPAATIDDLWHLGSCTKAFTATLCGVLIDAGSLRWDSTVGELLGAEVPAMDAQWRDVRLDELLRHRGGAPKAASPDVWRAAWECADGASPCRKAFVASLLAKPLAQPRGTFEYSNQGYSIAGRMCEVAAGATWEELVRTKICEPLGITSLGFGVPAKRLPERATHGHNERGDLSDVDNPPAIAPAGTMHMTITDWARFVALHTRCEAEPRIGLSAETLQRLHEIAPAPDAPGAPATAMGWMGGERPWGGAVLTHSGSNTCWFCVTWLSPSRRFAVVVTANRGGRAAERACDAAAGEAIGWWQKRQAPVRTPDASKVSSPVPLGTPGT